MADSGTITIGYSLSQTGRFAERGAPWYANAYRLWADQVNAGGGILGQQVRLLDYDDESSADKAADNYRRLIEQDGLDVLLGPCHTALTPAVTPVIEQAEVLLVQGTHGAHADFQVGLGWQSLVLAGLRCCGLCQAVFGISRWLSVAAEPNLPRLVYTNGRIGEARLAAGGTASSQQPASIVLVFSTKPSATSLSTMTAILCRTGGEGWRRSACDRPLDHGRSDDPRISCLTALAHAAGIAADRIWHSDLPGRGRQ